MKNNRIDSIINQIKNSGIVVDVGSDHAQLAIKLLTSKKAQHVYNIEISNKPYKVTVGNLKKHALLQKTTNILDNGLKTNLILEPVDYCVIAGMGAKNIVSILQNKNKNIEIENFILVPNNHPEILRGFLKEKNYQISYEEIIEDKKYYYSLITTNKKRGFVIKDKQEIYFGPYNLKHPTINFKKMHQQRIKYIENNKLHGHNPNFNQELKLLKEYKIWKLLK